MDTKGNPGGERLKVADGPGKCWNCRMLERFVARLEASVLELRLQLVEAEQRRPNVSEGKINSIILTRDCPPSEYAE